MRNATAGLTKDSIQRWASHIQKQSFVLNDVYKPQPVKQLHDFFERILNHQNHLIETVSQSSSSSSPSTQNAWYWGSHFLYNTQLNKTLGTDGYDNYQAPVVEDSQVFSRRLWTRGSLRFHRFPLSESPLKCCEKINSIKHIQENLFLQVERKICDESSSKLLLTEMRGFVYTNQKHKPEMIKSRIYNNNNNNNNNNNSSSSQNIDTPVPSFRLSPRDLLYYSQLTNNLHKIHLDPVYCRHFEGLPDVLVHGPLQVSLLLYYFAKLHPLIVPQSFTYRTYEPCYAQEELGIVVSEKLGGEGGEGGYYMQGEGKTDKVFELTLLNVKDYRIYMQGSYKGTLQAQVKL
ncbi:hypothetical protein PVL30_004184 [Lodderomyces elongisporus]|uniref:uncharacterized protein n=1 Tax=Lodderomyces elongisporus TaxID=36914 RepID=UPI002921D5F0|nr:uncharacterized protein PVL30_004184 [Lodderomyces elongisporus]WLF80407.1 hypothetical protein PVL30_004184 [Lodderomyces elongisporus]